MRLTSLPVQSSAPAGEGVGNRTVVVLDTSVLLSDPESIFAFPDADVVLPLTVIEELDDHKKRSDDVGHAARSTSRLLEELRLRAGGDLCQKVDLPNGGSLKMVIRGRGVEELAELGLDTDKADSRILAAALGLQGEGPVRLVSADVNLRLKAAALGLEACEYVQTRGGVHDAHHPGWQTRAASSALIDEVYAQGFVAEEDWSDYDRSELGELRTNEYAVLRSGHKSALVRRVPAGVSRFRSDAQAWGLRARSKEQGFALDLLLDETTPVVALSGKAGTGKSLLALAAGLEQVFEQRTYDRLMILRPVVSVGNQDIGFLPGTVEEKLGPWMEAIVDAMVALGTDVSYAQAKDTLKGWTEEGRLTMEAVTFLRGRSLQRTFVMVDEAQNLEPLTLKTILTRLGAGSKVVFTGDVSQIDNPFTSARSNALSVLAERFSGQDVFGHLVLTRGERSRVADLSADLL